MGRQVTATNGFMDKRHNNNIYEISDALGYNGHIWNKLPGDKEAIIRFPKTFKAKKFVSESL